MYLDCLFDICTIPEEHLFSYFVPLLSRKTGFLKTITTTLIYRMLKAPLQAI